MAKQGENASYSARAAGYAFVVVGVVLLAAVLWIARQVVLLVFAGVLLGVLLRGLARWLEVHTRLSYRLSLATVMVGLLGGLALTGWLLAPSIAAQADELAQQLPRSVAQLEERLRGIGWGRRLIERMRALDDGVLDPRALWTRVAGVFSTFVGGLGSAAVVLFTGLYLALEPRTYVRGLVRLFPGSRRRRITEVLHRVVDTLQWWLMGKFISMTVVGVLTVLGLWALGMPLALAFGVLAFFLNFIPNIGPLLSAVPPVLLALVDSPVRALWVVLLYVGIQIVETYGITPFIERRTVSMPPATLLGAQVLLSVLFGGLGLVLASPLAATALVVVQMLYIQDGLGDRGMA